MTPYVGQGRGDCVHEPEVVSAVLSGKWPSGADDTLLVHAADCEVCCEVATVAALMREDHDAARGEMLVPAAGQVWWRAAVRARLESTQAATRPITWMHGITAAIVAGVVLAALTAMWPYLPVVAGRTWEAGADLFRTTQVVSAVADGLGLSMILGLFAAAFLALGPLALYFVLSDD